MKSEHDTQIGPSGRRISALNWLRLKIALNPFTFHSENLMRKQVFILILFLVVPAAFSQQALDNNAILRMVKAGLGDSLVISKVQSSPGQYDTSTDGLIALKSAGVHDAVIAAMFSKSSAAGAPVVVGAAPAATAVAMDPDDPNSPHEAGIWIYSLKASGHKLSELEPSVYSQGMTYGLSNVKTKAVIRNAHANAHISDPNASFYFYFEKQAAGLSNASTPFGGTSTPNEYTLLRFDVKGDTRETTVGKYNALGSSGGSDDKATISFSYEKIAPGVYKVTPKAALQPGEYGFITASGAGIVSPYGVGVASASRVFDFGVTAAD
jgi:hypothetical protein